ncbi:MAG: hypothetical protein O3A51_02910 [Verrucomicrobia bacterium]|nr:hypothetical protein [Verrucomicrobiota bacterium]
MITAAPTEAPTKASSPPWREVTSEDVTAIIADSHLAIINDTLAAVADPPLPPELTLAKTLALVGTALSQPVAGYDPEDEGDAKRGIELARVRIRTAGGQACNVWHLCVAESGSWKDAGNLPDRMAAQCGWAIGTSGSAEGLADAFTSNGGGLLVVSEFQPWIEPRHWQHNAASWLTSAFNKGHFKVALSKHRGGSREARYCFPNIIANIQPQILAAHATPALIDSGFLPRFLITRLKHREAWRPSTQLVDIQPAVNRLHDFANLEGDVETPSRYLDQLLREFIEHDAPLPGHYSRLVNEYGPRLAVMLSGSTALEDDDWTRAATILKWLFAQAEDVLQDIATDETVRRTNELIEKVLAWIKSKGKCSKTELARRFSRDMGSRQRDEVLRELQERGEITIRVTESLKTDIFYGERNVPQVPMARRWQA